MNFKHWVLCATLLAAVPSVWAQQPAKKGSAQSQSYPQRPVRVIVPFTPGGSADIFARIIGQKLSEAWGEQVVVDNRPGSGGLVGTETAAKAAPDGHTVMMGITANIAINPAVYRKLPYDPTRDFVAVTLIAAAPYVLVAPLSLPVQSAKELIALARAKPGELNYASLGTGSAGHLTGEMFATMAGIKITHIPYKVLGAVLTDIIAGQTHIFFLGMLSAQPQVKAGKLRALAVTGAKRSSMMPELPTIAESGVPGYEVTGWYGVFAPTGTPAPIVKQLHRDIVRAMQLPEVRARLEAEGAELVGNTPEQFAAYVKSELVKWDKVVKAAGARAD